MVPVGEPECVRIVSERQLKGFAERHPQSESALDSWRRAIKLSAWKNPAELKAAFNLGGNKFRLIAYVHYRAQIVYVKRVLTHEEYDEGDWK